MGKNNRYVTVKKASILLSIPLKTVYRLIKNGKINAIKIGGRVRCLRDDVERIRDNGTDGVCDRRARHAAGLNDRKYQRINTNLSGQYSVSLRPFKEITGSGIIKNLSEGGVYITCPEEQSSGIDVDDAVDISFSLGKTGEDGGAVFVQGRVVRKENGGMAVRFRQVDGKIKEIIRGYIGC
jgi:excisionase family DNA binding protein